MTKKELSNKSEKFWNPTPQQKPKKVIMLLVDALREDFVQFEKNDTK
jgi:predicted AlkP superfamily pyrophosphatase or phosphodiesterase